MRVLLATVPTPGERVRKGESLGLRYLAATAMRNGHEMFLNEATDAMADPEAFAQDLLSVNPDVIGFGVQFSKQAAPTAQVAAAVRRLTPVPLVVGGQALNFAWRDMLDLSPALDVAVCFEAEETFIDLLSWLQNGRRGDPPVGLVLRVGGGFETTGFRDPVVDLDGLPFPYRDEGSRAYTQPNYAVLTSRGCQSGCTFCSSGNFGNRYHKLPRWRARSAANVASEIRDLALTWGARAISIVDDDFLGGNANSPIGIDRALAISDELQASKLDIKYSIELRADEMLKLPLQSLQDSGLSHVFIGLDGATEADLKLYAKGIHLQTITSAINKVQSSGLTASYGVIMFNPLSTVSRVRESVEFLYERDVLTSDHLTNRLLIYRGSPLLQFLAKQGSDLTWSPDAFEYTYSLAPDISQILEANLVIADKVEPLELAIRRLSFQLSTGIALAEDHKADWEQARCRLFSTERTLRTIVAAVALEVTEHGFPRFDAVDSELRCVQDELDSIASLSTMRV